VKILVTGAAGFVGSHVVDRLLADGHDVVGLDAFIPYYPRSEKEENLKGVLGHPRFTFAERDLRTDPLADLLHSVDGVIHEAAMAGLMLSWTDLDLYSSCNLIGTQRLLDAVVEAGVPRFVHVSTSSVYGAEAVGNEDRPTVPTSPYGITKLAAEHLVRAAAHRHGVQAAILRYFSVYGPRQRPDMAYHLFTRALWEGRPITVYGDGLQSRSNTYVDDCVAATLAALIEMPAGGTFNVGGGEEITLLDAIDILAGTLGVRPQIRHEPARPGDQRRTVADFSRATEALGYRPQVAPADGLPRQVAWHLARWESAAQGHGAGDASDERYNDHLKGVNHS
jgi:nucleoside-diphosphate-sugar epimerase